MILNSTSRWGCGSTHFFLLDYPNYKEQVHGISQNL